MKEVTNDMRSITRLGVTALASAVLVTGLAGSALAQDAEGNVTVSGSSTVEPISLAVAEEFAILNPNWTYSVEGPGTTARLRAVLQRRHRHQPTPRAPSATPSWRRAPPTASRRSSSRSPSTAWPSSRARPNEALDCLNFADLYAIFGPERIPDDAVRDLGRTVAALAAASSARRRRLARRATSPSPRRATSPARYDSFIEIALADIQARADCSRRRRRGRRRRRRSTALRTPGDIYVASAQRQRHHRGRRRLPDGHRLRRLRVRRATTPIAVKLVAIDGGDGTASRPTRRPSPTARYPIARPLFIYPDAGAPERR